MKIRLAFAFAMLSSIASAATTAPKVVFIGDYFTYNWKSAFAAHPTWINKGINGSDFSGQTSGDVLARFKTDVINLHPKIVHILVGAVDTQISSPASTQYTPPAFAANLQAMVVAAEEANIKVILGISPGVDGSVGYLLPQINSIIAEFGAENGVQVVNYGDALCRCVGALGQPTFLSNPLQQDVTSVPSLGNTPTLLPTAAGYALMTKMAETAVANEHLTLETGYLSNVAMPDDNIGIGNGQTNLNSVFPGAILQFTPIGIYSDGSTFPQNNTTWAGESGTWTSSNRLVMSVSPQGLALATTPGTTTIHYAQPNFVYFHSWVMTVK